MIRLSNQIHWEHSIVISWLDLIHTYFQDVLSQPMEGQEFVLDKYLEGSPFGVMTFDMGNKWISSKHLQRLSIFLFLKCSSSLLSMKETTDQHYACKNLKSFSSFDMNPKCCSRRKALLELHEWLSELLPGDCFIDNDMYSEKCMDFVSSFLQLYMQEVCSLAHNDMLLLTCSFISGSLYKKFELTFVNFMIISDFQGLISFRTVGMRLAGQYLVYAVASVLCISLDFQ